MVPKIMCYWRIILVWLSVIFSIPFPDINPVFAQIPELSSLEPSQGSERTVVIIKGTNLDDSRIVWNVGQLSEKLIAGSITLTGSSGQTKMFSIPRGALVQTHSVALENSVGRSDTLTFTVTNPIRFGNPRIDHVTLLENSIDAGSDKVKLLYVQGANIEVGSKLEVNGIPVEAVAHKVLRNKLHGINTEILGYPIHHYLSLIISLNPPVPLGQTLKIRVTGGTNEFIYSLPDTVTSLDSDGDGLLDSWEKNGFDSNDDGVIETAPNSQHDVNLPALGADPYRRDIFVWVDIMEGLNHPPDKDQKKTFDLVKNMFNEAPILNPYKPYGINLVIAKGRIPKWGRIDFGIPHNNEPGTENIANFETLKKENFTKKKPKNFGKIYRYCIWASKKSNDFTGAGSTKGFFIATDESCEKDIDEDCDDYHTDRAQAEIFVHELGHNLNLTHGGGPNSSTHYKPNYWSVMSYSWALRTTWNNELRKNFPTCSPLYYGDDSAKEINGELPNFINGTINYSEGMGPTLDETDLPSELTGVCGVPIDWNKNGGTLETGLPPGGKIKAPVYCSPQEDLQFCINNPKTEHDFADWPNLKFSEALK